MVTAIRTTARAIHTALNFCMNPICLHSAPVKGCTCCAKGHGTKKKAPARRKSPAKRK